MHSLHNASQEPRNNHDAAIKRKGSLGALLNAICSAFVFVEARIERARQRRALMQLPDHILKDIGLSRYDAHKEFQKPFWKGDVKNTRSL